MHIYIPTKERRHRCIRCGNLPIRLNDIQLDCWLLRDNSFHQQSMVWSVVLDLNTLDLHLAL